MSLHLDVHQHIWTPELRAALSARRALPFVEEHGATATVHAAGEHPWQLDAVTETAAARTALLDRDGLDLAVIAISSPIGIEALPREEAWALIEAHLDGVTALGPRFAAWGPLVTDRPEPADVDALAARGVCGISLPAGAVAGHHRLPPLRATLERVAEHGLALFVHPGRAHADPEPQPVRDEPPWWAALTDYPAQMAAAWLTWMTRGVAEHPELTTIFAMLAGLAPLAHERLHTRGGPPLDLTHPRVRYDTSSYGTDAIGAMERVVGPERLLYGSDRPVLEPLSAPGDRTRQQRAARLLAPVLGPLRAG